MTSSLFSKWIDHFILNIQKTKGMFPTNQNLKIFDGHNSHVTLEICKKTKEVGLDLLSSLSHTSHALQPLDVVVFKPFKALFRAYKDVWTMGHRGQKTRKEVLA